MGMIETLFLQAVAISLQSASPPPPSVPQSEVSAQAVELSESQRAAIRCSAAFALVSGRQTQNAGQSEWPELAERGREFFVVTLAGIMEERSLDRATLEREVRMEAQRLSEAGEVEQIMPACLLMLQAAGL